MRDIKFRGIKRNPYGDKWVEGYYAFLDGIHVIIMPHTDGYKESIEEGNPLPMISVNHEIDITTLGQYTDLKDKNGKEIYEGDIIRIDDDYELYGFYAGEIYEVYFNYGAFRLKPKYQSENKGACIDDATAMTVVGNIYDNPELLKEE